MDFAKFRAVVFFVLLAALSLVFLFLIRPLFYPIFWAAVIASIFHPLYEKMRRKIRSNALSAIVILIIVALIILIPLALASSLLVKESIDIYTAIGSKSGQINSGIQNALNLVKNNHFVAKLHIDESIWMQKISDVATFITNFIFNSLKSITQNSVSFIFMFILMLYILFFFLRDGGKILRRIMYLSPIGDKQEIMFYDKFTSTARATLKGTIIIGLIQGTLGGLMFYVAGIGGALIWGLVMAVLSILMIGSYPIWIPAAIILLLLGHIWQGIFILAFGTVVIGTIDNLLRPMMVGKDIEMHPLLIFMSTIGGAIMFGLSGLVIGPMITAFLMTFWQMYEHYYKKELEKN